jgi:hypothetical protein
VSFCDDLATVVDSAVDMLTGAACSDGYCHRFNARIRRLSTTNDKYILKNDTFKTKISRRKRCQERRFAELGDRPSIYRAFHRLQNRALETFLESAAPMKRSSTIFLQAVVVLIGIGALALLLWEPHIEGRNAHATPFEIYFNDPFLAYAYTASIPFFVAVYQAFKVLGYAGQNRVFSPAAVKALRTIKYCAIAIIAFVAGGVVIILVNGDGEDRPAGVFMSILISFGSIVIATAAAMFERILQNAVDLKSENDLTV